MAGSFAFWTSFVAKGNWKLPRIDSGKQACLHLSRASWPRGWLGHALGARAPDRSCWPVPPRPALHARASPPGARSTPGAPGCVHAFKSYQQPCTPLAAPTRSLVLLGRRASSPTSTCLNSALRPIAHPPLVSSLIASPFFHRTRSACR